MMHPTSHKSVGFDVLRLLAAGMVIFGHAFPLTGHVSPGMLSNGVQTIGVKIFFIISGYLVHRSWDKDPNIIRYCQKRALRIMPGLVCLIGLTTLLLGPAVTTVSMKAYFSSGSTWFYFWNIAFYPIYNLPGVFGDNTYRWAVNGSLWSLPVEISMYGLVIILTGRNPSGAKFALPLLAVIVLIMSGLYVRYTPPVAPAVFWGTNLISALDAAFYFLAGATASIHKLERFRSPLASSLLLGFVASTVEHNVIGEIMLALTLPYWVISIGGMRNATVQRILQNRDYSYGLYLYGFPMQQTVVWYLGGQSALTNTIISLPLTTVCAVASWHFVERRALAAKPRIGRDSLASIGGRRVDPALAVPPV